MYINFSLDREKLRNAKLLILEENLDSNIIMEDLSNHKISESKFAKFFNRKRCELYVGGAVRFGSIFGACQAGVFSFPPQRPPISIERVFATETESCQTSESKFRQFLSTAPSHVRDILMKTGISDEQFDLLAREIRSGKLEGTQTALSVRGGDGFFDAAVFTAFWVYLNWLDQAEGFFVPNPGHHLKPETSFQQGRAPYDTGKGIGPRSITVKTGQLQQSQESSSENENSKPYDYGRIHAELEKQENNRKVEVMVGGKHYSLPNPYQESASELEDQLAGKLYGDIRKSETDIDQVAANLGYKRKNVQRVKDHVFNDEHRLDSYAHLGEPEEVKQFDPDLQQALAWMRLQEGTHTPEDLVWMKHEFAEHHHESTQDAGYSESHARAQGKFDGCPWGKSAIGEQPNSNLNSIDQFKTE